MTPSPLFEAFLNGSPAKHIRIIAARGAMPLPPEEMVHVLAILARDAEPDVAAQAKSTLEAWPSAEIVARLRAPDCPEPLLTSCSQSSNAEILEAILNNRARLLEVPEVFENLKSNPAMPPELRRIAAEIEQEFFAGKKTNYSIAATAEISAEAELAIESEPLPDDLSLEGLPVDPAAREGYVTERLSRMTVRQKVQVALLGPREARSILIRDTNRQVAQAALQSPKLTDSEVEAFAAMRNVSQDVLRELGNNRAWLRTYGVVLNLVRNPKTPPMTSQHLVSRLQTRDLQGIMRDRALPELVRRNAQRALNQRQNTKG